MATNILQSIIGTLEPDGIDKAAAALGESPESTRAAVHAAVSAVLGGLVRSANDAGVMSEVVTLLRAPAVDPAITTNPAAALDGVRHSLLGTLFGGQLGGITDAIASYSGVRSASASRVLGMAGTLVLGFLGARARREQLDFAGLGRLLLDEQDSIMTALPGPIAVSLGLEEPWRAPIGRPSAAPVVPARSRFNWSWPMLALAALVVLWLFTNDSGQRAANIESANADTAVSAVTDTAAGAVADMRNRLERTLPGGVELNVPPNGIEHQLVAFIEDPDARVDDTTWFDFDRMLFESGSASLRPEAREQLRNVSKILEAYPAVHVEIGGYGDDLGDAATNVTLSQRRAETVKRELEALGVVPTRLEAEGYGARQPVAENSTGTGRTPDRRIALRVTKK